MKPLQPSGAHASLFAEMEIVARTEYQRMKFWLDWRALLGIVLVLIALARCCYSVAKDPNAWREMDDPSCLPEHRCGAL